MRTRATTQATSPRERTRDVALGLLLALCSCLAPACGGGGGGGSGTTGTLAAKPNGQPFIVDANRGGTATRLRLVEVTWGRLVDIHDVDDQGRVDPEPVYQDIVINESIQTDAGRFRLETNPVTLKTRLIIRRERGAPNNGDGTFEDLFRLVRQGLPPILPRHDDGSSPPPYSYMTRNGCLSLRFDDVLDDSPAAAARLVDTVRVLTGYAPDQQPFVTRIFFDPNYGAMVDGDFHSTRILVDMTVTEAELGNLAFGARLNSTGLPASQIGRLDPNISVRIPTVADQQSTFFVLRGLNGVPLTLLNNGPVDPGSPTQDVVRAFRSGNRMDTNNGFLVDSNRPQVVGTWSMTIEGADPDPAGDPRQDFLIDVAFSSDCRSRMQAGDTIEAGSILLGVSTNSNRLVGSRLTDVRVRVLDSGGINDPSDLLGTADFLSTLDPDLGLPEACWISFIPKPDLLPSTGVTTTAQPVFRFTEPMDPASVTAFDSFIVQRGGGSTGVVAENVVVARIEASEDQKSFFFVPTFPFAHVQGQGELFNITLGGVTDLAGNQLANGLASFDFSIDPNEPTESNSSVSFRFSDLNEVSSPVPIVNASNENDLRGQFLIDTGAGILRPRSVAFAGSPADRTNPVPSLMTPFLPGIQTPLTPFGSKMQTVWRYVDFGWLPEDETRYNLDVIGLSWAPVGGGVVRDTYPEFEIRLSHCDRLPDEKLTSGLLPMYQNSGLRGANSRFAANVLTDPLSPQKVVHPRALGYEVNRLDRFLASSGTLMVPYPLNRVGSGPLVSYTWRDNAVLNRGGRGGSGIPMDNEIGPPLNIFPNGTSKIWRQGNVPSVNLPLLMEFRCFPSDDGLGLNSLDISLAINSSIVPTFRSFSSGGVDVNGLPQEVDPANEPFPRGGYNPTSTPPGRRTPFATDNSFYIGQLDTVIRISRAHTVWVDSRVNNPTYAAPEVVPDGSLLPQGTEVILEYRGATGFDLPMFEEELPFVADNLDYYGDIISDVSVTTLPLFLNGDNTWTDDLTTLNSARYFQIRITFVNNIDARTTPELSAIGIPYLDQ